MQPLEGKVAFITGAGRAIGRAVAEQLAGDGADIIATDIGRPIDALRYPLSTGDDLAETAARVKQLGRRVLTSEVDVRDPAAIRAALDAGVAEFGRLDIVCANAGIASFARAEDLTDDEWGTMIDVNLTGVFNTVREAIPHLRAGQRGGSLVLMSSVHGIKGAIGLAHYTAAKHGVIGLMKVLALELAADNIRANCILPAAVPTGILDSQEFRRFFLPERDPSTVTLEDLRSALDPLSPLPVPWVEPEDVAGAVAWLASDAARYVTGVQLPVDMGVLVA